MTHLEHETLADDAPVRCAVVTVSDTRTPDTDTSGALMKARLAEQGIETVAYHIIKDDASAIIGMLDALSKTCDAVLINGGTGIAPRDVTYEALSGCFEKTLTGFGELFRMLSYQEIGPAAMLSRATAGTYSGLLIFSTPGSTAAVRLAMDRLILPQIRHLVWEMNR